MSKTRTLAATGLAGLVLGAGIGVAAAGQDNTPPVPDRVDAVAVASMDGMGATAGEMPADHDVHHPDTEE